MPKKSKPERIPDHANGGRLSLAGRIPAVITTYRLLQAVRTFWKRWDEDTDFEAKVSFDSSDRERISQDLVKHIVKSARRKI